MSPGQKFYVWQLFCVIVFKFIYCCNITQMLLFKNIFLMFSAELKKETHISFSFLSHFSTKSLSSTVIAQALSLSSILLSLSLSRDKPLTSLSRRHDLVMVDGDVDLLTVAWFCVFLWICCFCWILLRIVLMGVGYYWCWWVWIFCECVVGFWCGGSWLVAVVGLGSGF